MRKLIITSLLFSLFVVSCTTQKKESDIVIFEETLSENNLLTLNKLVENFDEIILEKFPSHNSLDSSYKDFLKSACSHEKRYYDFLTDSTNFIGIEKIFKNSDLEREIILTPDSLILTTENKALLRLYTYQNKEGDMTGYIQDTFFLPPAIEGTDLTKIDFYKLLDKHNDLKLFNVFGEYYQGLEKIKYRNDFIPLYLDFVNNVLENTGNIRPSGFVPFNAIASELYHGELPLSDYFIKRIIVIEFLN